MTTATMPAFGAAKRDADAEPIRFTLDGEPEPFSVHRPVPGIPLMELAAKAETGDLAGALGAFYEFLSGCLGETEWPRFRKASTRARLDAHDLMGIARHIITEATGRPTTPPSHSPNSSGGDGRPSSFAVSPEGLPVDPWNGQRASASAPPTDSPPSD